MNNGKWKDRQILDPGWIGMATRPSIAENSYGYMWWLNTEGSRTWENTNQTLYYAAGFGGNFIVIVPEKELVIVTRWLKPSQLGEMIQKTLSAFN